MGFRETLVHLFIPHHTNNHRAKVLHIDSLAVYLLFFVIFNFLTSTVHHSAPQVLGYATDIYVDQLLSATNAQRTASGLEPLQLNSQLSQAAALKAQNMLSENYWAHNSPSGKTPWVFINQSGYRYTIAGENLAKNFSNSQGVVDAWMASPSHKDNVMKPGYRDVGFAVVNGTLAGEETTLVVQMFGSSTYSASQKPATPLAQARSATSLPVVASPTVILVFPTVTIAPEATIQPTAIPLAAIANPSPSVAPEQPQVAGNKDIISRFAGISVKPAFDLGFLNKAIVFMFFGAMLALLTIDAIVIRQKRVVRVSGHTFGHLLFFGAMLLISLWSSSGSII
jgi:hypothetical protein